MNRQQRRAFRQDQQRRSRRKPMPGHQKVAEAEVPTVICPFLPCDWFTAAIGDEKDVEARAIAHLNADHPGWTMESLQAAHEALGEGA